MKIFIVLAIAALASSEDLEKVLQSPGQLKALFSEFSTKFNKHFTASEAPMRLRFFRKDLKSIVKLNKEHGGEWKSGINQFTAMTAEEKQQYLVKWLGCLLRIAFVCIEYFLFYPLEQLN